MSRIGGLSDKSLDELSELSKELSIAIKAETDEEKSKELRQMWSAVVFQINARLQILDPA